MDNKVFLELLGAVDQLVRNRACAGEFQSYVKEKNSILILIIHKEVASGLVNFAPFKRGMFA